MHVHLDTDLGTDPDDVCALAMLLGWPGVHLTGVTTSADPGGRRAGYVAHCLRLLGRTDVRVAAGQERSLSHDRTAWPVGGSRYWPRGVEARPSAEGAAHRLLLDSIERGAVVVAVGPCTNLATLETEHPGALAGARVVLMGGWIRPAPRGFPAWGPGRDHNVAWDTRAARTVLDRAGELTLSTLTVSMRVPLRARDLPRLRSLGPMGRLIARQSLAHAEDTGKRRLGPAHEALPDDLLNFHYDPLACAAALGWEGATVEPTRLRVEEAHPGLRWVEDPAGEPVRVVVDADGTAFAETWFEAVRRACAPR